METKICSICQLEFTGFGNNADPVNKGRCCNSCNASVVVPARLNRILQTLNSDDKLKLATPANKKAI